jgi:hypothetical protein
VHDDEPFGAQAHFQAGSDMCLVFDQQHLHRTELPYCLGDTATPVGARGRRTCPCGRTPQHSGVNDEQ